MARVGKHQRVGLALGSGGARGWAHLGVLQALRERGVQVDYIAGTSMGAVVGAFLAAGREDVLREVALHLDWKLLRQFFWEVSLSRSGLTDGRRLLEETRKLLGIEEFAGLNRPLRVVATDLSMGGEVVLGSGNLLQALRATISIPGVFSPVQIGRRWLVDGGLVNPVPVNVARDLGAGIVIAVDVSQGNEPAPASSPAAGPESVPAVPALRAPRPKDAEESAGPLLMLDDFLADIDRKLRKLKASWKEIHARPAMLDVMVRSVRIMEAQIARNRRKIDPPDILIEPNVGAIGTLEFQRAREAIAAGHAAARQALD